MRTPLYSTSRWSESCDTSTQRRNTVNNFPVPFRHHFGTRPTWQLILASLQASLHAHTPRTQLQVVSQRFLIWVKSGPLQCIHHLGFVSTLYVRLLTQPYNMCGEWFYCKCVLQCYSKICHGIGKRKNVTSKFSGQETCFIQLVSLARPSLAIAREGPAMQWDYMIQCVWLSWLQLHVHV